MQREGERVCDVIWGDRKNSCLKEHLKAYIYIYIYKLSEIILSRLEIMNFIVYNLFFLIQRDVYYGISILNSF